MEYQIYKVKEKSDEFEKFHYNIKTGNLYLQIFCLLQREAFVL